MQAGVINDCIDSDTLNLVADTLRSKQEPFFTEHSVTWPSNRNTKFFPILEAKIYPLLKDHFDPMEIVIINYTECMRPFGLHFDDWQTYGMGPAHMSILFPISENNIKTYVFDEKIEYKEGMSRENKIHVNEYFKDHAIGKSCFRPGMEHMTTYGDKDILNKLKLLKELPWKKNSAIYWDSNLLHGGSNINEKRFIIMHTVSKAVQQ